MFNEVEIKSKKSFSIFPAIGLTGIIIVFINDQRGKLFDWKHFNPNGINSIIFLLFLLLTIVSWLSYFDNNPSYRITKDGIWYRKNLFTRQLNSLATWDCIEYYFIQALTDKMYTEELIIKLKDREKYFKIMLTGQNIAKEDLLSIMTEKSKEFNFQDLGFETNRYSKY